MSFLKFEDKGTSPSGLTKRWAVQNNSGETIGWIDWRSGWRRYVFNSVGIITLDANCLREIAYFLETEMHKR